MIQKYATGWYLCSSCEDAVEPDKAEIFEKKQEVYCEECILQGEHH